MQRIPFVAERIVEAIAHGGGNGGGGALPDIPVILRTIRDAAERGNAAIGILAAGIADGAAEHGAVLKRLLSCSRPRHAEHLARRSAGFRPPPPLIGGEGLDRRFVTPASDVSADTARLHVERSTERQYNPARGLCCPPARSSRGR